MKIQERIKRINPYYRMYYDLIDHIYGERDTVEELSQQLHLVNQKYEALVRSLDLCTLQGYTIFKVIREPDEEILVFTQESSLAGMQTISLRLYAYRYDTFAERYRAELNYHPDSASMKIEDNYTIGERGRGYGSRGLDTIIQIAKEKHMQKLWGELSPVDISDPDHAENRQRVFHFYERHGFTIKLAEDGNSGKVYLLLGRLIEETRPFVASLFSFLPKFTKVVNHIFPSI